MGALLNIQAELKAPKSQFNSFGRYNYRSCEDILEALKPLLKKYGATLSVSDEVVSVGGRIYVKSTASFLSGDESVSVSAFAREPEAKKGMDEAQITGTASSYARKYALNGLFLIDDSKDADTDSYSEAQSSGQARMGKEHMAEMKRWTDGTFTEQELADIKSGLQGPNWAARFEHTKAEYERRRSADKEAIF